LIAGCVDERLREPDPFADPPIVTFPDRPKPLRRPGLRVLLRNLPAITFSEFLALPSARIDYALGAALFAKRQNPNVNVGRILDYVEDCAERIQRRIGPGAVGVQATDAINDFLFIDQGFAFDTSDPDGIKPENLYIDQVIRRRRGYCVSLTLLYLAVAQKMRLPVYGVRLPAHFIARFDDGKTVRNIETTDNGLAHPNSHYIRKYRIAKKSIDQGVYMRNLEPRQVFVDMLNNRGTLLGMKGDAEGALREFALALSLDNGAASVHYNSGVMLMRMNKLAQALESFGRCLHLDPTSLPALTNTAEIHTRLGAYPLALKTVNRAINIAPKYPNGYLQRGLVFQRMGKQDLALQNIERALQLDEKNGAAYVYRARIRRDEGDFRNAIFDLNAACQLSPRDALCFAERGLTFFSMGRYARALEDLNQAVRMRPNVPQYRTNRGLARLKTGDLDGAREDFDLACRLAPYSASAWSKRAALAIIEKKPKEACAFLDRALEADRDHVPSLLNRGIVLHRLGRHAEAAADLVRCISRNPNQADAYAYLGKIYHALGQREKALYFLKEHLRRAKDRPVPNVKELLAKLKGRD
jgi:tetratricopeptide (TPR) repeat protein